MVNCDQIKTEIERLERRQQAFASGREKKRTTIESAVTRSRPESRMEVDEKPRSSGRFNLGRLAQEHMNEGPKTCTPPEPVPSRRNLEAGRVIIGHCAARADNQFSQWQSDWNGDITPQGVA